MSCLAQTDGGFEEDRCTPSQVSEGGSCSVQAAPQPGPASLQAIDAKMAALRQEGRHVLVVGDMNVAPWDEQADLADTSSDQLSAAKQDFPDLEWFTEFTQCVATHSLH